MPMLLINDILPHKKTCCEFILPNDRRERGLGTHNTTHEQGQNDKHFDRSVILLLM